MVSLMRNLAALDVGFPSPLGIFPFQLHWERNATTLAMVRRLVPERCPPDFDIDTTQEDDVGQQRASSKVVNAFCMQP